MMITEVWWSTQCTSWQDKGMASAARAMLLFMHNTDARATDRMLGNGNRTRCRNPTCTSYAGGRVLISRIRMALGETGREFMC